MSDLSLTEIRNEINWVAMMANQNNETLGWALYDSQLNLALLDENKSCYELLLKKLEHGEDRLRLMRWMHHYQDTGIIEILLSDGNERVRG
jgi:hypothetical protein